jgi:hypothetical protein
MMEQTKRPKEIRLNIPYISKRTGQEYIIPQWLTTIPITIIRCEDFGPATKFIPTLQHFIGLNQKILVYDDDSVMPRNAVETFDKLSQEYPLHCITCASYRFVGSKTNKRLNREYYCDNLRWSKKLFSYAPCIKNTSNSLTFTDIVTGWSGFLLTPNMVDLTKLIDVKSMPDDAFYVDDVVISACILANGTQIMTHPSLIESKQTYHDLSNDWWNSIFKYETESLGSSDNREMNHDEVMEHFFSFLWGFLD